MVKSGFFNSNNHDRIYGADDIGGFLKGIITDGIVPNYPKTSQNANTFTPLKDSNTVIKIAPGKAFLNSTWIENTDWESIELPPISTGVLRSDAICIDVNKTNDVRETRIIAIPGVEGSHGVPDIRNQQAGYYIRDQVTGEIIRIMYMICYIDRVGTVSATVHDMRGSAMTAIGAIQYATSLIHVGDPMFDNSTYPSAEQHNAIFRGNDLGASMTAGQYAQITAGTFEDLYIGDYWNISGVNYRIAGFDYFNIPEHHIVVVPDVCNTSMEAFYYKGTHGYRASELWYAVNEYNRYDVAFGDYILPIRYRYTSESDGVLDDRDLEINAIALSQVALYGSNLYPNISADIESETSQLPLFKLAPKYIGSDYLYYLRDICNNKATGRGIYNVIQIPYDNTSYHGPGPIVRATETVAAYSREMFCIGG